jgi:uroporphyrinogen-III synthase
MKPAAASSSAVAVLPLAGAAVVITRPSATAAGLRRRVRALGAVSLALPGVALRGADDPQAARSALRAARTADVVVFTSPAAVRYAFALEPGLCFRRSTEVCSPGAATARALVRRGIPGVSWPRARQDSEGLLRLPALRAVRGRRVVLIGAPEGRELLARSLRRRGARVEPVMVYRRVAPRYTKRQLDALAQAPEPLITLLTSAAALDHLRAELPPALYARLVAGELVVSSQRLACKARDAGFGHVQLAASPAPADLVRAACAALARHRL